MKKIDIDLIWNYSFNEKKERVDNNFFNAFSNYLIITKKNNEYKIKNNIIASAFANKFQLHDEVVIRRKDSNFDEDDIYFGEGTVRCHTLVFDESDLIKISTDLHKNKINYAIIDEDNNSILFENYNEYNGYKNMCYLFDKGYNFDDMVERLKFLNKCQENGYKKVVSGCYVELLHLKENIILKYRILGGTDKTPLPPISINVKNVLGGKRPIVPGYKDLHVINARSTEELVKNILDDKYENEVFEANGFSYKIISVKYWYDFI